jgi:serine/threonine-protein kinase
MIERYGDYELVRYLTAGGMADLYLARSPKHENDLVLKKIQPRYVEFTRVVKMFIDEGRIAQALEHPNIVKIVDVGHHEGTYFIAMEYIPGHDLLQVAKRGVEVGHFLPRHLAVAILVQALRGLQHAHEKNHFDGSPLHVVHCDISPGNIVVSWGGTAKIVDFGIARATIQLRVEDHSVAGKYNYMAPEQIRGELVDARADLFAVGVLLYELTVGKRLFRGRPEQVIRLVLDEPIAPPTTVRPDYPPALEAIVMKALERDREKRWQSAREMRDALRAWLAADGHPAGKREIAAYLREIFEAPRTHESEEFVADEDDDEELVLEKSVPRSASGQHVMVIVDPEEPENESGMIVLHKHPPPKAEPRKAEPAPAPAAEPPAPASTVAPLPLSRPTMPPPPAIVWVLAVGAVVAAAVVYFLLHS